MTFHPDWCDRTACTAYIDGGDGYHRSEPLVVKTDDPAVGLYLSKVADMDGAGAHIDLAVLELVDGQAWHLTEPLHGRELIMPLERADTVRQALAELV